MESHGWYRLAPFLWDGEKRVLRRKEVLGPAVVELEITHRRNGLRVLGASDSEELRARIGRMFQLHVDLTDFHVKTRTSPSHAWVEAAGFGRLLCGSTRWEDAVKIIATTNTLWSQTIRMVQLLVEKCGREGAFPTPAEVARFSAEELQRDCRLGYRAKSVRALADVSLAAGDESLGIAPDSPATSAERFREYLKLPGIGPYGAAHLLAMDGRHDFIAVDTEFRRHVRETWHRGRPVSDAAMLRRYAKWGEWKYLAYWSELWGSVDASLQPEAGGDK